MKRIDKITEKQIKTKGVQSLATRPNEPSRYGKGNLTPEELKKSFDKLATFLAEKINEISDALSGENAGEYVAMHISGTDIDNLDGLIHAMQDGDFADKVAMVYPSAATEQICSLQEAINLFAEAIARNAEGVEANAEGIAAIHTSMADGGAANELIVMLTDTTGQSPQAEPLSLQALVDILMMALMQFGNLLTEVQSSKLSKITSASPEKRAYAVSENGSQEMVYLTGTPTDGKLPLYKEGGRLEVNAPTKEDHAASKGYVDGKDALLGARVSLSLDPSTFVLTAKLKNDIGEVLSQDSVDLPLESMLMGASFHDGILTVSIKPTEGNPPTTVDVNISDLVSGLASSEEVEAALESLEVRINQRTDGAIAEIELLKGDRGEPGIYYGSTEPTGPSHPVWIDTSEDYVDEDDLMPSIVAAVLAAMPSGEEEEY